MTLNCRLASSLVRVYPRSNPSRLPAPLVHLARGERGSAQVVLRHTEATPFHVELSVKAPKGWEVRVRRVGYVPMPHFNPPIQKSDDDLEGREHLPGLVPDPLFEENWIHLPGNETHAFWLTLLPKRNSTPGVKQVEISIKPEKGKVQKLRLPVKTSKEVLARRKGFSVTNWFYLDCLMSQHRTGLFDKRFWQILPNYLRNMADHGQDTVYSSVFSVSLDGERAPSQLLRISEDKPGKYSFDWRDVRRFVKLAKTAGLKKFEWSHLFSQWGVKHTPKLYHGQGEGERLLWKQNTSATSKTYRNFLEQFMPAFHRFLSQEKLLDHSLFHLSDEPSGEHLPNYQKARALLRDVAPWMKVMDALSHKEFAEQGLTDMPVPSVGAAIDFYESGIDSWCYFCCDPRGRYLNRFLDTPLAKIRASGWLFYRWPFKGFLHWGYNYWNRCQTREVIDPFTCNNGGSYPGWAFGDPFVVYPGAEGPLDSIRWEIFAESLQDYSLLQSKNIEPNDRLLTPFKSFEDFPKKAAWFPAARSRLL